MESESRKVLAVMFTDLAGFTAHMERNETEALGMLATVRNRIHPLLRIHSGSLIKEMGDGTLSVFTSARSAMNCARKLQNALLGMNFRIRIGIHWGNVLIRHGDILGDTVNVASRLEKLAPPGGVCVSGELLNNCGAGRRPAAHHLGLQKLKGLGRLLNLFYLKGTARHPLPFQGKPESVAGSITPLAENLPSIAVIPFENLGTAGDDFYAFGITSDLVSSLSAAGSIAVTPLSDVVRLRKVVGGTSDIAQRLSVRFIVKGSLWRNEERFQLSIELHDQKKGRLIWTDNWSDNWFELPSITDKLADGLLKVLGTSPKKLRTPEHFDPAVSQAYELYLQGSNLYHRRKNFSDLVKARELLRQALSLQPDLVPARLLLGTTFVDSGDCDEAESELTRTIETAQSKGDRTGYLHSLNWIGITQMARSDFKAARSTFIRTMMMARTLSDLKGEARALSNIGLAECNLGRYDNALDYMDRTLDVPGVDSMGNLKPNTLCNIGLTHWRMGDNASALDYYRRSLDLFEKLENFDGQANLNMNLGIVMRSLGRFQESLEFTEKALVLNTKLGNRRGECRTLVGIGNIHRYVGCNSKALASYRKALHLSLEIKDRMAESIIKTNIGVILNEESKHRAAIEHYQEALHICREIGDREGEGENLSLMGEAHRSLGQLDRSAQEFEEAISVLEETGAELRTVKVRVSLAHVLLNMQKQPDKDAIGVSEKLVKEAEHMISPNMNDETETLLSISDYYSQLSSMVPASRKRYSRKSRRFLADAYSSLMKTADCISDPLLKESFLNTASSQAVLSAMKNHGQTS